MNVDTENICLLHSRLPFRNVLTIRLIKEDYEISISINRQVQEILLFR